jgi:hypothetical protein
VLLVDDRCTTWMGLNLFVGVQVDHVMTQQGGDLSNILLQYCATTDDPDHLSFLRFENLRVVDGSDLDDDGGGTVTPSSILEDPTPHRYSAAAAGPATTAAALLHGAERRRGAKKAEGSCLKSCCRWAATGGRAPPTGPLWPNKPAPPPL